MAAADAEICRPRRYHRFGIYGEKEFAWMNPGLKCRPVFYHIDKHPTLSFWIASGAQRGVDGIGIWDAVAAVVNKGCVATALGSEQFTHALFKPSCPIHTTDPRPA